MFFQVFQRKHSLTLLPKGGGPRIKPRSILTDHTKAPSVHLRHQWAGSPWRGSKAHLVMREEEQQTKPLWSIRTEPAFTSHTGRLCLTAWISRYQTQEVNTTSGMERSPTLKKKRKKEYETPFLMLTLVFSSMVYNPLCCLTQTNTAGASKTDWRFT